MSTHLLPAVANWARSAEHASSREEASFRGLPSADREEGGS